MDKELPIKRYAVKLKAFQFLSYLIIIFSVAFIITASSIGNRNESAQEIAYGVMGLIGGAFIYYFGRKERKFLIFSDRIEYWTSKVEFIGEWDNISLVKSYQEMGKKAEYLVIMREDERVLKISTAFFDRELLIQLFNDLIDISKDYKYMTIEDDLNWSNNSEII